MTTEQKADIYEQVKNLMAAGKEIPADLDARRAECVEEDYGVIARFLKLDLSEVMLVSIEVSEIKPGERGAMTPATTEREKP